MIAPRPLIDGRVQAEGIDLEIRVLRPREIFARMLEHKAVEAGTHITLTNRCTSREQRDAMVSYGAEKGARRLPWERLAALLRRA